MANTREIQSRMKSIQDTMKITVRAQSLPQASESKKIWRETERILLLCRR